MELRQQLAVLAVQMISLYLLHLTVAQSGTDLLLGKI
jgi:hypothetical protein